MTRRGPRRCRHRQPADAHEMPVDAVEPLLARLTTVPSTSIEEEDQHEAAELLHGLGTSQALARLGSRPGHVHARAVLRDARWDLPAADPVPVIGGPSPIAVARELIAIRVRRVTRMIALRWAGASIGGGLAGFIAGALGGLMLAAAPGSAAPIAVAPVLAVIGALCGSAGGAGVGAGISLAEASARSWRGPALAVGGALGGGIVGAAVQWLGRWTLAALVGLDVDIGGAVEGIVIGAAAGAGYAMATREAGRARDARRAASLLCRRSDQRVLRARRVRHRTGRPAARWRHGQCDRPCGARFPGHARAARPADRRTRLRPRLADRAGHRRGVAVWIWPHARTDAPPAPRIVPHSPTSQRMLTIRSRR